ncbi:unnamed protein product [Adineta steineri]|uniref:Uncharacterized protein n=1 Tax=Adineta steineri TaxID=433720 RepID=A0A818SA85_9BILA|nr:unnamed protein product [Adineta steineri]
MVSPFSVLSIFLFITFIVHVDSVCVQGQVVTQVTKYGTVDTQCIFNNIKVLPGSTFKLAYPDCLECRCTAKSMACCGFGYAAGVAAPPPGCVAHNDACKLIFVKANNATEVCKPNKSPSTIRKKPSKSSQT